MSLHTLFSNEGLTYTGRELRPHFLLEHYGKQGLSGGSALFAARGPCRVETAELVDWEDRLANDRIEAAEMVHFLGEFFGTPLREGVVLQRLLMSIMETVLRGLMKQDLRREGDDLFVDDRKLSVSIVTASPVSVLLHAGINIDPSGAPVPAVGLTELGVPVERFSEEVLRRFREEWDGIGLACVKVRPVM